MISKVITVMALSILTIALFSGCLSSTSSKTADHLVTIAMSPKGTLAFSASGNGGNDLYLMDLATRKVTSLTNTFDYERDPAFSPDGKNIIYSSSAKPLDAANLFMMPASGGIPVALTSGGSTSDDNPSFSPDGKTIVFSRAQKFRAYKFGGYVWDNWDIYTVDSTGKNIKQLTKQNYSQAYSPVFCDNNKTIVFTGNPPMGKYFINALDNNGKLQTPRQLASGSESSSSRDGKKIVFISDRKVPFEYEVWIMNADGSSHIQVTHNKSYNSNPVFTPNGKQIIFLSDPSRSKKHELWQVDVNGKNLKRIADSKLFDNPTGWKP